MASTPSGSRGIALVVTLLAVSLFSALGLALTLSSSVDRLASANHDDAVRLLNMADAGLELAVRDLAAIADWNTVLLGVSRSPLTDGLPDGVRRPVPGIVVDLTRLTSELTCGRAAGCTDATRRLAASDRPWGDNNPWWRAFLYTSLTLGAPRHAPPVYVIVWLGDDANEVDADPLSDGGGPEGEGRYILRARSEAHGAGGARRAVEAELSRVCTPGGDGGECLPGIRVQSWRVVTAAP